MWKIYTPAQLLYGVKLSMALGLKPRGGGLLPTHQVVTPRLKSTHSVYRWSHRTQGGLTDLCFLCSKHPCAGPEPSGEALDLLVNLEQLSWIMDGNGKIKNASIQNDLL